MCCIQWFKDTNLKANHNWLLLRIFLFLAVFNGSKILIWKQITTRVKKRLVTSSCIQWFKDTNLKANHNMSACYCMLLIAVFNGSKILIWKQITTSEGWWIATCGCIQWFKDTNLKANHNQRRLVNCYLWLYSIVQRY